MTDPFDFQAQTGRFAVIGNPVAHSQSPQIHSLFAQQFGIALEYGRIQADPGGFDQAVSHFIARGGDGLNVTLPFKPQAWQLCARPGNSLSARAQQAGAVNTLRFEAGAMFGDNTDGAGLVRDIERNHNWKIAGKRVLVLGAGGAVRGILAPLSQLAPRQLTVANRTAHKARALAKAFGGGIHGCGLERIKGAAYDLIINGSAASLQGEAPDLDAGCLRAAFAYDMMYAPAPTVFMRWALANGAARASDGLGMLVEQAAESFYLWHRRRPDTAPALSALRAA
ncbi:MAG: shikimate dehydrogenase [Gammaproteobacteria bacterium]